MSGAALFEILRTVARRELSPGAAERLRRALTDPAVDLNVLPQALHRHGLIPLGYHHLIVRGGTRLPPPVERAIARAYQQRAARQAMFVRLLRVMLSAFKAAGIEVVSYKGPTLALQLYGHYALRQYSDLDLLVRQEDLAPALRLLAQLGVDVDDEVDSRWDGYLQRIRHTRSMRDRKTRIAVELHWRLVDRLYGTDVPMDWLLDAPATIELAGSEIPVMRPDRQFLALCIHGATHHWERLSWLAEIAEITSLWPDLDGPAVVAQAQAIGFTRQLAAAGLLVRDIFGVAPAAAIAPLTADVGAARLAARIAGHLAHPLAVRPGPRERIRLGWMARAGWRTRAVFAWRAATDLSPLDLAPQDAANRSVPALLVRRAWRLLQQHDSPADVTHAGAERGRPEGRPTR